MAHQIFTHRRKLTKDITPRGTDFSQICVGFCIIRPYSTAVSFGPFHFSSSINHEISPRFLKSSTKISSNLPHFLKFFTLFQIFHTFSNLPPRFSQIFHTFSNLPHFLKSSILFQIFSSFFCKCIILTCMFSRKQPVYSLSVLHFGNEPASLLQSRMVHGVLWAGHAGQRGEHPWRRGTGNDHTMRTSFCVTGHFRPCCFSFKPNWHVFFCVTVKAACHSVGESGQISRMASRGLPVSYKTHQCQRFIHSLINAATHPLDCCRFNGKEADIRFFGAFEL